MNSRQVLSDLYNTMFTKQMTNLDLSVDYSVWNRIKRNAPDHYLMPDQVVLYFLHQAVKQEAEETDS